MTRNSKPRTTNEEGSNGAQDCLVSQIRRIERNGTWSICFGLEDDAWIADALVAINQINLLGGDFPRTFDRLKSVRHPASKHANFAVPEFADGEI
jgi:hypothetical protein